LYNAFSGQVLFEPIIFQFFNIVFTGVPIIFYAVNDLEFEKKIDGTCELFNNPWYYRIGMENTHFSKFRFWCWVLYGCAHSAMVYYINGFATENTYKDESGREFGFWEGGQTIYLACILLANVKMLMLQHNWTCMAEWLVFLCTGSYFLMMWAETLFPYFPEVYKFGEVYWCSWVAWLSILFVVSTLWHVDKICLHWAKMCFVPSYRKIWWERGEALSVAESKMEETYIVSPAYEKPKFVQYENI
jgi:magnesium-transporting ATPase (P-type)